MVNWYGISVLVDSICNLVNLIQQNSWNFEFYDRFYIRIDVFCKDPRIHLKEKNNIDIDKIDRSHQNINMYRCVYATDPYEGLFKSKVTKR